MAQGDGKVDCLTIPRRRSCWTKVLGPWSTPWCWILAGRRPRLSRPLTRWDPKRSSRCLERGRNSITLQNSARRSECGCTLQGLTNGQRSDVVTWRSATLRSSKVASAWKPWLDCQRGRQQHRHAGTEATPCPFVADRRRRQLCSTMATLTIARTPDFNELLARVLQRRAAPILAGFTLFHPQHDCIPGWGAGGRPGHWMASRLRGFRMLARMNCCRSLAPVSPARVCENR